MADRTWNAVDARLYEERWSRNAKLIMGVIIARCPNPYGVYDVPYVILETLFAPEDIDTALGELIKLKRPPIKLYRDGEVVWIIRKWGREGKPNEKQQKGASNTIEGSYNEVWEDFKGVYKEYLRGIDGVSDPLPSDSDSDTESDTEKNKIPDADAPDNLKSKGKPSGRDATAIWTDEYRAQIDSTYKPTPMDAKHCLSALKHLGYDLDLFRECVKNCIGDSWFRDNKPGAAHFYRHIEKYKKPPPVDDFGPEVPTFV